MLRWGCQKRMGLHTSNGEKDCKCLSRKIKDGIGHEEKGMAHGVASVYQLVTPCSMLHAKR